MQIAGLSGLRRKTTCQHGLMCIHSSETRATYMSYRAQLFSSVVVYWVKRQTESSLLEDLQTSRIRNMLCCPASMRSRCLCITSFVIFLTQRHNQAGRS